MSDRLYDNIAVGDTLEIIHPYGEFAIDAQQEKPVVMLAAGVGITPVIAALNHLAKVNPQHTVHLLYAAAGVQAVYQPHFRGSPGQADR
ncbi:MAG: hypothetical protein ACAH05_08015 [Methylophilus sp.]|nr:hypothetical protein [Methylophilus sp.]